MHNAPRLVNFDAYAAYPDLDQDPKLHKITCMTMRIYEYLFEECLRE